MGKLINLLKNKKIYFQILYWIFYLIFFTIQRSSFYSPTTLTLFFPQFLINLIYLPGILLFTYFVTEFLIPRLYMRRKLLSFSLYLALTLLIYPLIAYLERVYIINIFVYEDPNPYSIYNFLVAIMVFIFGLAPLAGYKIALLISKESLYREQVEHDKLMTEVKLKEAELQLLKGQLHPHFLFNTLNNLYSLSIQKSARTSEVIIKISDLLNYIIYDCNTEKVSLEKEIEFIKSYIDLEKLRYDDTLKITTSFTGDFQEKYIAPMILHTFIENSFKHGASRDTGSPWIDIRININSNILNLNVINSRITEDNSGQATYGIGIENAKKRLALIYPDKHFLEIVKTRNTFNVSLEIQL